MTLRVGKSVFIATAIALSNIATGSSAWAADAYLCEADRVVYVEVADLERMKHTDPCIAAYYGITIAQPAPPPAPQPAATPPPRPVLSHPELRGMPDVPRVHRASIARDDWVPLPAAVAAPGTDFRNVRIINAGSKAGAWFRHAK